MEVYSHLAESGLAVKHPEPVWRNLDGEIVDENQALGLKSEYELIHPELVVFVDEVGSNTSQTKDGQVGCETYLCAAKGRPQQQKMPMSQCWPYYCTRVPLNVCYFFLLLQSLNLNGHWASIHLWTGSVKNQKRKKNMGEGKVFSLGPACSYRIC